MFGFLQNRRRKRLLAQPVPDTWRALAGRGAPYYGLLGAEERERLWQRVRVLLDEKRFEGCGGFVVSEEHRILIGVHAALLILNNPMDYYPALKTILVYPGTFLAEVSEHDGAGVVHEGEEARLGESWGRGVLTLSWGDVQRDMRAFNGHNVILHEFAHQLDQADGEADGWPGALDPALNERWRAVMNREFTRLGRAVDYGGYALLPGYGAENPAEFFACSTEVFFEQPRLMQRKHAELYELLCAFYAQDPVTRFRRVTG